MPITKELEEMILEGKPELVQLGLKAYWALWDLADYFKKENDTRQYKVNQLLNKCQELWGEANLSTES